MRVLTVFGTRPEAISAGTVKRVGTDRWKIIEETMRLLTNPGAYRAMSLAHNPYGDGRAAGRIVEALEGAAAGVRDA